MGFLPNQHTACNSVQFVIRGGNSSVRMERRIILLFKKGSRNKSENYRPVSLTSVICKLLERLIIDHLVDFLVKNKLINPSQHGFLKARSCLTNMLCFLEDVTKRVDEGSPVDIIHLDLKKSL